MTERQLTQSVDSGGGPVDAHDIDSTEKLAQMEFLIERYQAAHGIALLFSGAGEHIATLQHFVEYLVQKMSFQKAFVLRMGENVTLVAQNGFSADEILRYTGAPLDVKAQFLKFVPLHADATENAELVVTDSFDAEHHGKLFGLSRYLIGHTQDGEDLLFVVAGFDTLERLQAGKEFPLSTGDVYWFSQLILLCGSFLVRTRLFGELTKKASENSQLAEQREKQIEERTRALLDALFDAKKFRLVIERADVLVALIDSASHRFMFVNALWERITGYSRDSLVGKKTFEFLEFEPLSRQPKLFSPEFEAQLLAQGSFHGDFVLKDQAGDEQALSLSLSRFEDDAGGMLYVVIGRDIAEDRERSARERLHVEEVEKLNQLMINRELRIIELKRQLAKEVHS